MKAMLIGNGFTSQIIKEYSNYTMMERMHERIPKILNSINNAFSDFRILKENIELEEVAMGYCGEMIAGVLSLNQPITDIVYDKGLISEIVDKLDSKGFDNSEKLYINYFEKYGLIYETQHKEITNIESALKVVSLFIQINRFTEEDYNLIKKFANQIYYNDGRCTIDYVEDVNIIEMRSFFHDYDIIFTTNYDLVIDTLLESDKVLHLHGGFNYKSQNDKVDFLLELDNSYLVWGINGDEKKLLINKGSSYSSFNYSEAKYDGTLLAKHMQILKFSKIETLSIFGYSGENDGHINDLIKENRNINKIIYYTSPSKTLDAKERFRINRLFCTSEETRNLILKPWDDIWNRFI